MHELSIAENVLEIAQAEAEKHDAGKVGRIVLEVGKVSGVVREALEFSLKALMDNEKWHHTEVEITEIPGRAKCCNCAHEFDILEIYDPCPECSHLYSEIIRGEELNVKSLVLENN